MKLLLILLGVLVVVIAVSVVALQMPGRSHRGALPAPADTSAAVELRRDVVALASGEPRNVVIPESLHAAAAHIEKSFADAGFKPSRQTYTVEGVECANIEVEVRGKSNEIVVIGAHYDSVDTGPGADDNASGVAMLLALARRLRNDTPTRTIRFVAFANEEPPHFQTAAMGSYVYAKRSHERGEKIVAMLSIESVGYYTDQPRSQAYPPPLDKLYPSTGNFIGFAGNVASRALVKECVASFRRHAKFPSEGAVLPEAIPQIGWSDQWSFWRFGWPAIMVTDTAPFRNPNYHTRFDTPETLDYERMARVLPGLAGVIRDLAR